VASDWWLGRVVKLPSLSNEGGRPRPQVLFTNFIISSSPNYIKSSNHQRPLTLHKRIKTQAQWQSNEKCPIPSPIPRPSLRTTLDPTLNLLTRSKSISNPPHRKRPKPNRKHNPRLPGLVRRNDPLPHPILDHLSTPHRPLRNQVLEWEMKPKGRLQNQSSKSEVRGLTLMNYLKPLVLLATFIVDCAEMDRLD